MFFRNFVSFYSRSSENACSLCFSVWLDLSVLLVFKICLRIYTYVCLYWFHISVRTSRMCLRLYILFTHKKKDAVRARVFDGFLARRRARPGSRRSAQLQCARRVFSRRWHCMFAHSCIAHVQECEDQADIASCYILRFICLMFLSIVLFCMISRRARSAFRVVYVAFTCMRVTRPRWRFAPARQAIFIIYLCVFFFALPVSYGTF